MMLFMLLQANLKLGIVFIDQAEPQILGETSSVMADTKS